MKFWRIKNASLNASLQVYNRQVGRTKKEKNIYIGVSPKLTWSVGLRETEIFLRMAWLRHVL